MKTGIIQDEIFLQHDTGPYHPERKERLVFIHQGLQSFAHREALLRIEPRLATHAELQLVHPQSHIRKIESTSHREETHLDPDTTASSRSYEVARFAVGGLLALIDSLFTGEIQNGFAFVRPPGHHAEPERAMGFCLFSNVAIGAAYALSKYPVRRVMVVDFDVHHGNGTQSAFYDRNDVLFVSTHQWPLYPGTGDFGEVGEGQGKGFTLNFPLPSGSDDSMYRLLFEKVITPIGRIYKPELLLVSAGYDAYVEDPLAGMSLTIDGFHAISRSLVELAQEVCRGRILFALEGGYHLRGLQASVLQSLDALIGQKKLLLPLDTSSHFEPILKKSRDWFSPFWHF